jgi:hypothetical protein
MATRRGAATAAGVPNPAEPSINDPKRKAMIMAWSRYSSCIQISESYKFLAWDVKFFCPIESISKTVILF